MFKKIFLLIVVYTIFIFFFKGYYAFYPTIPVYPNNKDEVKEVKQYIKSRTQKDIDFFKKTNKSVVAAFTPHVKESLEELTKEFPHLILCSRFGNTRSLNNFNC